MMGMVKHRKITINAVSFMDLQLKLAKHPNWRILEISRLKFGFKIILQKAVKYHRQHFVVARIPAPCTKTDFVKWVTVFTILSRDRHFFLTCEEENRAKFLKEGFYEAPSSKGQQ